MRELNFTASLLMGAILLTGCSVLIGEITQGSGTKTVQNHKIDDFTILEVSSALEIQVYCGEEPNLEISGDDNIVPRVMVSEKSGTLSLKLESGSYRPRTPIQIIVSCNSLESVDVSGASTVRVEGLASDSFLVECSGASQVEVEGSSQRLIVDASGASQLNTTELAAENVKVEASGASRAIVCATRSITADVSGASTLRYSGDPDEQDIDTSGASSVEEFSTRPLRTS